MGMIPVSDIVGIFESNEVICTNCCTDDEWDAVRADEVITLEDTEMCDPLYFCDRCKERLPVEEIKISKPQ